LSVIESNHTLVVYDKIALGSSQENPAQAELKRGTLESKWG
jgi:hypothetical protein